MARGITTATALVAALVTSSVAFAQIALVDNYSCYRVYDQRQPRFATTTVSIQDQFVVADGTYQVRKPYLYCQPANVTFASGPNAPLNPNDDLLCYRVRGPRLTDDEMPLIQAVDHFGTVRLKARRQRVLCVPASKTILP